MNDPLCIDCGRPKSEHHAYRGNPTPPGCKCANDGSWNSMTSVPPVCDAYVSDGGGDNVCVRCEHDEACHS